MTKKCDRPWRDLRVRTPIVLQMEEVECGAAALGIVLAHHGLIVPLEELRIECGIGRDGCKASNLVQAARAYGLTTKGYRVELEALRELPLPMILLWRPQHFLVLEGIVKRKVYLNDPKAGPRIVSEEELDECFSGLALTFERGATFRPGGSAPSLLGALQRRLAGFREEVWKAVAASLLLIIPGLLVAIFSKAFVDNVLVHRMEGSLRPLFIGLGMTAIARCVITWFQRRWLLSLEIGLAVRTSREFLRHVLTLPIPFFSQRVCGEISNRVGINDRVAQLLSRDLAAHAIDLTQIVFYALFMFYYDVGLTLVGVFAAASNLVALVVVSRKRSSLNQRLLRERGILVGETLTGIQAVESLKAAGREPEFLAEWLGQQSRVVQAEQEMAVVTESLAVVPFFLSLVAGLAILAIGSLKVMAAELTVGALVAFQSLMSSFLDPVSGLVGLGAKLQEVRGDMIRLDDVLRYPVDRDFAPAEEIPKTEAPARQRFAGNLELRNVDFAYGKLDPPFIRGVSLCLRGSADFLANSASTSSARAVGHSISKKNSAHPEPVERSVSHSSTVLKQGGQVGLVGQTGSGKSTLAKLIAGLYQPSSGEILFDGIPRGRSSREWLASSMALVPQEICLFEGTVRDNLTMWDDEVPECEVLRAAKDACIHDEIMSRPGGYESRVENGGGNFSGGQRQRLQIARALVRNPSLLLLDEAMSALDLRTEGAVRAGIARRGCSCLIIAHSVGSVQDCDEILVLDNGKVVQRGKHAEMIGIDGPYARLFGREASKRSHQTGPRLPARDGND